MLGFRTVKIVIIDVVIKIGKIGKTKTKHTTLLKSNRQNWFSVMFKIGEII